MKNCRLKKENRYFGETETFSVRQEIILHFFDWAIGTEGISHSDPMYTWTLSLRQLALSVLTLPLCDRWVEVSARQGVERQGGGE